MADVTFPTQAENKTEQVLTIVGSGHESGHVQILEVNEVQLDTVEEGLAAIPKCLRSATLALRGCYTTEASSVEAFTTFKEEILQHALVFKDGLLPLSINVTRNMKSFFDNYLALEFEEWRDEIADIASDGKEYEKLCNIVASAYTFLATDLKKQEGRAAEIVGSLNLEAKKFKEQADTERAIAMKKADLWDNRSTLKTVLVFVPVYGWAVLGAAYVNKLSSVNNIARAIAADTEAEMAFAATTTVTDTLIPAVLEFIRIMVELVGFFKVLTPEVQAFCEAGESALEEKKRRHFKLMQKNATGMQARCTEFISTTPAIESDLESIPQGQARKPDHGVREVPLERHPRCNTQKVDPEDRGHRCAERQ